MSVNQTQMFSDRASERDSKFVRGFLGNLRLNPRIPRAIGLRMARGEFLPRCCWDVFSRRHFEFMNRKKILVVDDDPVVLKALSIKLNARGYDALTATDGALAVSYVRKEKPDLILLDLSFPPEVAGVPWDGFSIMEWLTRLDETIRIPIIVITGGEPAKYEQRAKATGATAFFHKPVDHEGLFAMIEQALAAKPTDSAG